MTCGSLLNSIPAWAYTYKAPCSKHQLESGNKRIEALKGRPRKCEVCGSDSQQRTYDWANLTGKYDDPSDYMRMCRSCHWKHDKKILNIHRMRKRGQ
jgi:hypothetical protein